MMSDQSKPISIYDETLKMSVGFEGYYSTYMVINNPLLFEQWISQWEYGTVFAKYYDKTGQLINDPAKIPYSVWNNEFQNILPKNEPLLVSIYTEGTIPSTMASRTLEDIITNDNFILELSLFLKSNTTAILSFKSTVKDKVETKVTHVVSSQGGVLEFTGEPGWDQIIHSCEMSCLPYSDSPVSDISNVAELLKVENQLDSVNFVNRNIDIIEKLYWGAMNISQYTNEPSYEFINRCIDSGIRAYFSNRGENVLKLFFSDIEMVYPFIHGVRNMFNGQDNLFAGWLPYFLDGEIRIALPETLTDYQLESLVMFMCMLRTAIPMSKAVVAKHLDLSAFSTLNGRSRFGIVVYHLDKEIQPDILSAIGSAVIETSYGDYLIVNGIE